MNLALSSSINASGPPGSRRDDEASLVVSHSLRADGFDASEDGTGRGTPLVPIAEVGAKTQMGGGRNGCGIGNPGDPMFTLQAGKQHGVGVRRLTPTECERLQGFPDGWTCLCQPLAQYDANRCTCPDGPRYKALGNAVTVPVIEWIGRRMVNACREGRDVSDGLATAGIRAEARDDEPDHRCVCRPEQSLAVAVADGEMEKVNGAD